jgi:hypothetical protein
MQNFNYKVVFKYNSFKEGSLAYTVFALGIAAEILFLCCACGKKSIVANSPTRRGTPK